ncbi:hypothetical protein ACFX2H_038289 [Malus domestica]
MRGITNSNTTIHGGLGFDPVATGLCTYRVSVLVCTTAVLALESNRTTIQCAIDGDFAWRLRLMMVNATVVRYQEECAGLTPLVVDSCFAMIGIMQNANATTCKSTSTESSGTLYMPLNFI